MKQQLVILTAIISFGVSVSIQADDCFDTYEVENESNSEKPRKFRMIMNGDGSVCAIFRVTENSDSLVRLEFLDGQGRLRFTKTYFIATDGPGKGNPERVEIRHPNDQLFWRWTSESKIYQMADGRQLDGCRLHKEYPMFYWGDRTLEMQDRICQPKNWAV